ncbi:hypothetical protein ACJMK2_007802 [Sinanodonta woodiana]|uniref:Glycine-rich protein n=1 Tax=Sinanodonta woodiana TaxID=1069815 RepID=A0ABD3VKK6_SINWO
MSAVLICCLAAFFLSGVCGQGAGGANVFSNPMMMMSLMGGEFNMADIMRLQMMSSMFRGRGAAGGSASAGGDTAGQLGGASGGAGAGAGASTGAGAGAGASAGAGGMCSGPNRIMNMICMRTMLSAFN